MKLTRKTLMLGLCACAMQTAWALGVEDYCDITTATPKGVKEMTPMPDGESYAAISDDGKSIETFSYKTGQKTGTLFSIDGVKGDVKIPAFEGYELSDDGRRILLWNDSEKVWRFSFTAEYYVYDTMRQTMKRVSEKGPQRGATLSHDGLKVAYMRDNNIYIANLDYGTDNPITKDGQVNAVINGIPDWGYEEEFNILNTMRWSADDNVLVYVRFDESDVPTYSFDSYRGFCMDDPLGDPYPAQYEYKYSLAGYPVSRVSLHAYDLNTRATKTMDLPLTDTDYLPMVEFDGKGENLMVGLLNHDQNRLRLYRVNPASTVAHLLLEERAEGGWLSPFTYQMSRFYPDFFVYASERSGYRHLYKYNYEGVMQGELTRGDFNITDYYGYDSKKGVHYVQTTSLGATDRSVAAVNSKGALTLLTGKRGWESADWSKGFGYWLRQWSDVQTPPVYTLCNADGKELVTVEDNAEYKAKYAGAPRRELLKVKNDAGEEMDAYMIKPAGFDPSRKYPVLMWQYNGPDSQEVTNRWKMDGLYYLCSEGYVIGCVDGRGTGNRSRQWAYSVYRHLGDLETADQIAGARWMASQPFADSNRIGCFGWSYGGYMTLMELQRPGNPFKCGVSMAPVTDWRYYDSIYTERYMLTPQQNEAGYDASSAIAGAGALNVPLLIMSGTSDDNVHFYNTLKYTSKLTAEGKLFDMMAWTAFDHSLRMCNARVQLYRKVAQFLKGNL
ncbi:MAG: DPP IV N-terminal domain-containing protein [Muribaculaceae bacterium]|nr:DPP IV N-terminal domain-containing protein [Muribaculaceae bacterium]